MSPSLTSLWPKQVTWPSLESVGGTLRATAQRIMDTRRGRTYGHPLQSTVAQNRLYFVPCTRRMALNLLGLSVFQELKKKKNQSYIGRPGGFLRLEISNWQLIRSRFYLSWTMFRNFWGGGPTFKILRFCIQEISFGNLCKKRQSGKNCQATSMKCCFYDIKSLQNTLIWSLIHNTSDTSCVWFLSTPRSPVVLCRHQLGVLCSILFWQ